MNISSHDYTSVDCTVKRVINCSESNNPFSIPQLNSHRTRVSFQNVVFWNILLNINFPLHSTHSETVKRLDLKKTVLSLNSVFRVI